MKITKEIQIISIISCLIVYFLIGNSDNDLWSYFYFLNTFLLIIILTKYNFDARFRSFIYNFCALNIIRLTTKFIFLVDFDFMYKVFFMYLFLDFFYKNIFKNEK